jgi:hypothetical protein
MSADPAPSAASRTQAHLHSPRVGNCPKPRAASGTSRTAWTCSPNAPEAVCGAHQGRCGHTPLSSADGAWAETQGLSQPPARDHGPILSDLSPNRREASARCRSQSLNENPPPLLRPAQNLHLGRLWRTGRDLQSRVQPTGRRAYRRFRRLGPHLVQSMVRLDSWPVAACGPRPTRLFELPLRFSRVPAQGHSGGQGQSSRAWKQFVG